jgi:tryptophan 2,3-dioxygenase
MPADVKSEAPSDRATNLQEAIDRPLAVSEISSDVGRGTHDYEVYLRTVELLSLQHPVHERVHPDELAFQIVHQVQELWLRLLAQECVALVDCIDTDQWAKSQLALERCHRILRSLREAMDVLATLTPAAFQVIRRSLGDGSGLQSPGFAAIRRAVAVVDEARRAAFERASVTLDEVYRAEKPAHLLTLCESLVNFDVAFQRWLVAHFHLVRRTIGVHREVSALDGYPTKALEVRMKRPLFPELWDLRVGLTKSWERPGGIAPGCPRSMD